MQIKNLKFKIKNSKRGFTLIEALVAITVLTVSIAGPITIASKSIFSAVFARDQITAFYLAQEAVEFVRNSRDNNKIKNINGTPTNWLAGLDLCLNGTPCAVDVKNSTINDCPGGCSLLKYDSSTGFYNYLSGNDSIFIREVKMTAINGDEEVLITVSLSWNTGIIPKSFVVKEHIFNW